MLMEMRDMRDSRMEIEVVRTREFRVRYWIAMALIRLGCRVLKMEVRINEAE